MTSPVCGDLAGELTVIDGGTVIATSSRRTIAPPGTLLIGTVVAWRASINDGAIIVDMDTTRRSSPTSAAPVQGRDRKLTLTGTFSYTWGRLPLTAASCR